MISSPCAMLITPITPKVMARPTAASSNTDPSESPNQTFCSCAHIACVRSMSATASCAASAISGASAFCSGVRTVSASRPPRPAITATAATRSSNGAPLPTSADACASSRARRTPGSVSAVSASSIAASCSGSPARNASLAAAIRRAGSACMSVSVETAARTARRSALFTLIAPVERAGTGPSDSPVRGSNASASDPRPVTRMTSPSDLRRWRSPSCSASSTTAARPSPVAPIAATTTARSLKLPSGSRAISSSSV